MDHRYVIGATLLILCVACVRVQGSTTTSTDDCIDGPSTWYRGTRDVTGSGTTCQRWDTDKPHKPKHVPKDGGHHNYCRNPDNDLRGTWCYTINNKTRWEYCNISKCPDDSLVIWTNYDAASESTHLLRVQADPEIVKQETDNGGSFNVTVLTGSNRSMTEYWALAADYNKKRLYFTDYRSEYIGVWSMTEKKGERYFEGMAHGVECIAYDWKTDNLYWTDSEFKWVMAAENTFNYYTPVYRTAPDPAYGLAVHSVKRLLIFSTYKALGSKIIVTDLAGKSPKTLFKFPNVFDVTGITIDYTDDRLYWTDFTGYGGMVMSSLLDGTNKTQHHYRGGSIFWGVAAYMDYLYVSDVHARYSMTGARFYSVWIITKRRKQVFRYTLSGKPRGIAVFSHNEEFSLDTEPSSGECGGSDCGHLCLPRINATRSCACSLGYHLNPVTQKCQPLLVEDDYLLVADAGQGKVFQIPITDSTNNATLQYSIVPLGHKWKAVTVAVDLNSKYLYWSDKKKSTVSRASVDGSRYTQIASSYANSMIVDPQTGNLFYADNERDTIIVSNKEGTSSRTIVKPEPGKTNTTSIRMITQDIKYKYIYWTDTFSKEGEGQVLRCRYDGSGKEIVLDKLNWPHAITIDYKTDLLYVAEAKSAIIYELDLLALLKINDTSPKQKKYKQYDISAYITRISPYIIDLKIHQGMAYVVDGKSSRLERFNLTEGAPSMAPYGPAEFFRVTTLSIYSNSFYAKFIKPQKNPCDGDYCREMCVPISDTAKKCLCRDGKLALGNICIDDAGKADVDISPPVAQNCPDDAEISLPSCASTASYSWTTPTWKDDKTAVSNLDIQVPTMRSPASLAAGIQTFSYTARDKSGNVGYCRFTVNVKDNQCPPVPNARPGMRRSEPTCRNRMGSVFNVTCITEGYVVWVSDSTGYYKTEPVYEVVCEKSLKWNSRMTHNSDCRPPPAATSSTTKGTSTTTKTSTPASTTKRTTTATQTTSTKVTTRSTTTTDKNVENVGGTAKQENKGLSSGAIAAIIIVVLVLIIVIGVVVFVTIRNRPVWAVTKLSFPVFWKSSGEDKVKMESSNNAYQIMS
uniref:low-density lipoprotein receptor-related protein 2-like isoform X3 n=1 Tax=Styela clava TaxID=7725 RepID=UPI001939CA8B|nr:low-density lipoprotein receptor-related protein 2-like isoform X3 [Styela clava]